MIRHAHYSPVPLLLGLLACGGESVPEGSAVAYDEEVADLSESLPLLLESAVRIGAVINPASPAEGFTRISDAQLTPDGRFIVVLDQAPPYVRVFSTTGSLETAFVPHGEGPGEAEGPLAIAVSEDRILVLEPGRASLFTPRGEFLDSRGIDFWPESAARGCDGDFLVYGPGTRTNGTPVWLRAIGPFDAAPRPLLRGATEAERDSYERRRFIGPRKLAVSGDLILVHHGAREPAETLTLSCPDYATIATDTVPGLVHTRHRYTRTGPGSVVVRGREAGEPAVLGMAFVGRTPVLSVDVGGESGTRLVQLPFGIRADTRMPDGHVLLDARPGSFALFKTAESAQPVPHLVLVDYDAFLIAAKVLEPATGVPVGAQGTGTAHDSIRVDAPCG